MFALIHTLFFLAALFFGFRWELLVIEGPFDAMYRAYVLESLRLIITCLPFFIVLFRRGRPGFKRQFWCIGLLICALYLIYFSIFGQSGFVLHFPDVLGEPLRRLVKPIEYAMFGVWLYFVIFSVLVNRDRSQSDVDG